MEGLTLFNMLDAKMAYVSERQNVLARNISMADMPGYRAQDVERPDFKQMLQGAASNGDAGLKRTNNQHIQMEGISGSGYRVVEDASYEVKPNGNTVDLEEQMLKASRNNLDAGMVVNLYIKHMSMMRIATQGTR